MQQLSCLYLQGLERLSLKAIHHRLGKRRLQQELDLHRVYLLTRHYEDSIQGVESAWEIGCTVSDGLVGGKCSEYRLSRESDEQAAAYMRTMPTD